MKPKKRIKNKSSNNFEKEVLPSEKWLVSFNNHNTTRSIVPKPIIRQFYAQEYYEAYDIIRSYAEKLDLEIIWFKEKRNCSHLLSSKKFPQLESICVYCNRIFNEFDPIPCLQEDCTHIFCSRKCLESHIILRHRSTK